MKKDLFDLSIPADGPNTHLLRKAPQYRDLVTFSWSKKVPVYNWFYYKEGYAGQLVWDMLEKYHVPRGSVILDPFCGTGTTLLACAQRGYNAIGFDALPLGVFVANAKLFRDYDLDALSDKIREISGLKFGETNLKWPDLGFINAKQVFSKYARKDLLFFKQKIMEVEDEHIRNFLMLGLVSIVLQASNVKRDGGVLRRVKKPNQPPVRHLFKNKLKRMFRDLKKETPFPGEALAEARMGDARLLPLEPESVDACITSPPYLNWVDYSKIYVLELGLLVNSSKELADLRKRTLRSHVGAEAGRDVRFKSETLRQLMEDMLDSAVIQKAQVIEGYFEDMYLSMESIYSALKPGGIAALVVGNVCLPETTIDTDILLSQMGEELGFKPLEIIVSNARWCDVGGIRKQRPVRESIVVLQK